MKPISVALENGWPFDAVWTRMGSSLSSWARGVVERSAAPHIEVAQGLFDEVATRTDPAEVVVLARIPELDQRTLRLSDTSFVVVCDRPAAPGNLGSIIRSAHAFGADAVVVTGHAADIYDPVTVRASIGALFAVPTVHIPAPADAVQVLRAARPELVFVGTSARASTPLEHVDFRRAVALVFGNETHGLSAAWRELCDELATIPIAGAVTSLNLAAAASIFLNEVRRQRGA